MKCTHQHSYYEDQSERCPECGATRLRSQAVWKPDPKRHPTSLRKHRKEKQ